MAPVLKKHPVTLLLQSLLFFVLGLVLGDQRAAAATPPIIVTTTSIIADTTRAIAGETATVTALMGPGVDPHLYKASPGDLRALQRADIILHNGLHLEGKLADALEKLATRKTVVAVTAQISPGLLRAPQGTTTPASTLQNFDPHVWFDPTLWIMAAAEIRDTLIRHDPTHTALYTTNYERLRQQLEDLHLWTQRELAKIPAKRRILITAHDAFGYFGRAYAIDVRGIQGLSTDSEASLREIEGLVTLIIEREIPAVFVESSVSPKTVQALVEGVRARGRALRIGGELLSDSLAAPGTPGGSYIGMIRHNVTTIVSNLQE
jgi:manganese/zinc/iron transport system substrate-binding protein